MGDIVSKTLDYLPNIDKLQTEAVDNCKEIFRKLSIGYKNNKEDVEENFSELCNTLSDLPTGDLE